MVEWDYSIDPIPAQIYMFLDLQDCKLMSTLEHNAFRRRFSRNQTVNTGGTNRTEASPNEHDYLSRTKWVVIRSCLSEEEDDVRVLDEFQCSSKLFQRYFLEDVIRILPLEAVVGRAYCVDVKGTIDQRNQLSKGDQVICATKTSTWVRHFFSE